MKRKTTQRRKKSNRQSCSDSDITLCNRSGKSKKRLAVGGGGAAAALLVLLYFLPGQFGGGIGSNEDNTYVSANNSEKQLQNVSTPSKEETVSNWYHDGVVILRTKKDGYEIVTSREKDQLTFTSVDVEKLKKIVAEAPGNSQRIKVRILIDPSSTPKIEEQLETILREMNLMQDRDYLFVK